MKAHWFLVHPESWPLSQPYSQGLGYLLDEDVYRLMGR
jgi:hypothetical protein